MHCKDRYGWCVWRISSCTLAGAAEVRVSAGDDGSRVGLLGGEQGVRGHLLSSWSGTVGPQNHENAAEPLNQPVSPVDKTRNLDMKCHQSGVTWTHTRAPTHY